MSVSRTVQMICENCPLASACPRKGVSPHEVFLEKQAEVAESPIILSAREESARQEDLRAQNADKAQTKLIAVYHCYISLPIGGFQDQQRLDKAPNSSIAKRALAEGKKLDEWFVTFASTPPDAKDEDADPVLVPIVHAKLSDEDYAKVEVLRLQQVVGSAKVPETV